MELASYASASRAIQPVAGSDASGVFWGANSVGAVAFICAGVYLDLAATPAAIFAIVLTFLFRSVAIAFNWRTAPVASGDIFTQGGDTTPPIPPKDGAPKS